MKVATYARLSSVAQAKEGTIESQMAALHDYAKEKKLAAVECESLMIRSDALIPSALAPLAFYPASDQKLKLRPPEVIMNIQTLMMLFPVVFMFHDFEELCFLESWIRRNADSLRTTLIGKNWLTLEGYSTSAIGIGIMLMFLFVSTTSILSVIFHLYALFSAAMIVFAVHNLFHIVQPILLRRYIPAMGSSVITIFYPLYVLYSLSRLNLLAWRDIFIVSILFGALTFAYLGAAKRIGFWIDKRFNYD